MLSLLVWLMFGVVAVVPALTDVTWQTVAYAVLSLTVIRMLPVAVALAGARLGRPAVLFIGWFGPRGLASVVFALLALEDLAEPGGQAGHHRDRLHRAAQRPGPRAERRPAGQPLRPPAHPATRNRAPGRAGRDTRTPPYPPLPGRRPAWRRRKPLMTTDQVLPGPVDASLSRPGCLRAADPRQRAEDAAGRGSRPAAPGRARER